MASSVSSSTLGGGKWPAKVSLREGLQFSLTAVVQLLGWVAGGVMWVLVTLINVICAAVSFCAAGVVCEDGGVGTEAAAPLSDRALQKGICAWYLACEKCPK